MNEQKNKQHPSLDDLFRKMAERREITFLDVMAAINDISNRNCDIEKQCGPERCSTCN